MAYCTYQNDLGIIYRLVRATDELYSSLSGVDNYLTSEIVPQVISERIIQGNNYCPISIIPRRLNVFDDRGAEWRFTIPFMPYSDLWDSMLTEIESNPRIIRHTIKGEQIKDFLLVKLVT